MSNVPAPTELDAQIRPHADGVTASAPLLTHVNADTSWLLRLCYPANVAGPAGRAYFNILIDPWLQGPQVDLAGWFSTQYHVVPASVATINDLNVQLRASETVEAGVSDGDDDTATEMPTGNYIDAVCISHEFTDHCHQATLLQVDPAIPVLATSKAARLISSWNHFQTVVEIPVMAPANPDWHTDLHPLPSWIGISRLTTTGDFTRLHSALLLAWDSDQSNTSMQSESKSPAHGLVYTPHGIQPDQISFWPQLNPPVQVLALLHGLNGVSVARAATINLGAHNGLGLARLLQPKYWIGTHDEIKAGSGIIGRLLTYDQWTVADALKREGDSDAKSGAPGQDVAIACQALASGQSLVLKDSS